MGSDGPAFLLRSFALKNIVPLLQMEGRGEVEVDDLKDGSKGDKGNVGGKGDKGSKCRMAKKIGKFVATSSLGNSNI